MKAKKPAKTQKLVCDIFRVMKKNILSRANPELAKQLHPTKNGELTAQNITTGAPKKVWWICEKGHEYQATIFNRNRGSGCPVCSNRQLLKGYNDLQTVNPPLATEWNYKLNGDLTPDKVVAGSGKIVHWICPQGHKWKVAISKRNGGSGCPTCYTENQAQQIHKRYGTLAEENPELSEEWDYDKNGDFTPHCVTVGSGLKVWWIGKCGHSWESKIADRHRGCGCPFCAGRKVLIGFNDFKTINPKIANEWDFEKNGTLKPDMVTANSNKKVNWKCPKGHEYQAIINDRNNGRHNCPVCYKLKINRK
jgi:hypothetical protein